MDSLTFLSHLEKVKQTGDNKWLACCPSHDDRNPSLAIKETDGKILLHCFSGCQTESIVQALGMKMSDLMPDTLQLVRKDKNRPSNRELFATLEHEMFAMLSAIGHYKQRIPLHEQDKGRTKLSADRIRRILDVLY